MLMNILLAVLIVVSLLLTGIILLQRSEGGALGMGGGGGQFMSARGAADFLTRVTQVLGAIFFILALSITVLSGKQTTSRSVVDQLKVESIDPTKLKAPPPAEPAQAQAPAPVVRGAESDPLTGLAPPTAPADPFAPALPPPAPK